MTTLTAKWRIGMAGLVAAASLAACHGGNDSVYTPPTPPPPQGVSFTAFATQAFNASANSSPAGVTGVVFTFDADNNPAAFDTLIMTGSFQ